MSLNAVQKYNVRNAFSILYYSAFYIKCLYILWIMYVVWFEYKVAKETREEIEYYQLLLQN